MNKIDVLAKINPQMRAVLAREDELAGDANDTSAGFERMRENYVAGRAWWAEGGPTMAEKADGEVPGPHGAIPVRCYYPTEAAAAGRAAGEGAMPGIVYAHGGGFVLGNLDTHDRICRILADKTGSVVVAVDYRLSPEAKYLSAVREVAAVAFYLHVHRAGRRLRRGRAGHHVQARERQDLPQRHQDLHHLLGRREVPGHHGQECR